MIAPATDVTRAARAEARVGRGARWLALPVVSLFVAGGCELDSDRTARVIPGPTVPSTILTELPYRWDHRNELAVWVQNVVTRGAVSLEGEGGPAFIRVETGGTDTVIRGPDLGTPLRLASIRLRVRWTFASAQAFPPTPNRLFVDIHVQDARDPTNQFMFIATIEPTDIWTDVVVLVPTYFAGRDVRYVYFRLPPRRPTGQFDLDMIELDSN